MNIIKKTVDLGDGRLVEIETGKLAKQADGSVVVKYGNTMILATACADKDAKEGVDFMPLTVEYRESFAALGKFPGGFFKREGRPYEHEILVSRLVDRALRPLFPDDFHANVVVMLQLISADADELPDALACLAASSALAVSTIPFSEPVSEVRVARVNGKLVINPKKSVVESAETDIDMIVAATAENILMVEGEMKEVSEADMVEAIAFAHNVIKSHIKVIRELEAETGAQTKRTYSHEKHNEDLKAKVWNATFDKCAAIAGEGLADKHARGDKFAAVKDEFVAQYIAEVGEEKAKEDSWLIGQYYHKVEKEAVRKVMLTAKKRLDGRKMDEVRPIWTEVDYLPGAHGSAIFTRGETQSLSTVTLGTKLDQQMVDGVVINEEKKFMLNYNFPGYSTGEARVPRGTGRREIGHGNLALRALQVVVPSDSPYSIRVVSDILESNGSSSMATVCAGTLALMDAGVKIKKPVSGIAMGLVTDKEGNYSILSDILGDEDHLGDMDFKVCGTQDGITACQMDIKIDGLSQAILMEALEQAKRGRLHILGKLTETLSAPREDYKPNAPRVVVMEIEKEFIGAVIGTGGKVIQEIQAVTGTTITIEEVGNKGKVEIFSPNKDGLDAAQKWIAGIVAVPEVGKVYEATVKSIMPYGAFVEFLPGKQGLLHISEISNKRLENMDGIFKENEVVKVKLLGVEPKTGKFKLSRKALLQETANEN
ncbi:MAG: polyribonucleotide nucleotidyltransferase [Chitinophagales bacterium]|nr:polyribonucleotide nucleotidyltransferase [Chitinophagales bacterium]MCO5280764.1 polyribonucleotide nucleotidyltransferase [Chitinophagales bacterium]HRP38960.1 polyribonucleotide nucleotidyltransferase [Chitinophagales bacterium]